MGDTEKNENTFDYESLYRWASDENQRLRGQVAELTEKVDALKDEVSVKTGECASLKYEYNLLREQNARLFGEVCGLKFSVRAREMFADAIPTEDMKNYEY